MCVCTHSTAEVVHDEEVKQFMGWIEWKSGGDGNHFWFFFIISLSRALMNSPKYIPKNNKKKMRFVIFTITSSSFSSTTYYLSLLFTISLLFHSGRKIASVSIFNEWSNYVWLIIIHVTPSAVVASLLCSAPLYSYSHFASRDAVKWLLLVTII